MMQPKVCVVLVARLMFLDLQALTRSDGGRVLWGHRMVVFLALTFMDG